MKSIQGKSEEHARATEAAESSMGAVGEATGEATEPEVAAGKLREYENVFEGVEEMIAVIDRDFRYLLANGSFLRYRHKVRDQVVGRYVWEVLTPSVFEDIIRPKLEQCFAGEVVRFEMEYSYPALGQRHLLISYFPVAGTAGVERVVCILQDMTDVKRGQKALADAERKYREIFENAQEGIFQSTPDGRYLAANPALARMHGFDSPKELMRERTDISRDAYADPERREAFKKLMESEGVVTGFEFQLTRKDGERIWVSVNARVVRDAQGRTMYYEGTGLDITEQRLSQKALRESEERYRELFENSRDAIYVHDLGGRYVSVNRAAELLSGFDRQEILGKHYSNFIAPRNLKNARESFCRKLDAPVETMYEAEVVCKNGHRIPVEISSRMIYRDGQPIGVQGIARDITERRRAQQTMQNYSRRLVEVQEAERQNLSRELHDEIGQALTAIRINLEWMRRANIAVPETLPRIDESIDAVDDAVRRVRELALELRPSLLDDLGLASALRWYVDRFAVRTGINAQVVGDIKRTSHIPHEIETAAFRIVQEALTNVARHSFATRVSIDISQRNGELHLGVSDNGIGFDSDAVLNGKSSATALGLRGMQERALAVNGDINIISQSRAGTQILLAVPLINTSR
jgi:PAS domain S-box-containing protein